MKRGGWWLAVGLFVAGPAHAQLNGPASTGVSASLLRLFGTNNTFTAQAEVQVLGQNNQEIIGTPTTFTLLGNKIRVEVELARMRNRVEPDAVAQMKPLGLDHVVSIIRPETRTNLIIFPKLRSFIRLGMPPNEAEAFLRKARLTRTDLAKEKMEGYPCVKQRVVITDDEGQKSEATVWTAAALRGFPVCVATREQEGTVTVRFRKVDFTPVAATQFEPPAGFTEYADLQAVMAGPVVQFMKANGTALKPAAKPAAKPANKPAAKPAPKPATKPASKTTLPPAKKN
jgi:hypothetical protein